MPGTSKGTPAVTTTRSPWLDQPLRQELGPRHVQHRLVIGHVVHQHRRHAPDQRQRAVGVGLRGDGHDRHRRAEGGHGPGGEAARGEADDDTGVEQLGGGADRHRDRVLGARRAARRTGRRAPPVRRPTARSNAALRPFRWRSTSRAIRSIACTASMAYSPTAVSAESMTASVPSRIALATSDASARVGRGACTIDSSIWVAVMTGLPRRLASRISRFWTSGTSSNGSSTPRSPRATMTASVASRMAAEVQEGGVLLDLGDQLDPLRDQRPELGQVLRAPHEGHADVVHPERHRVLHVLPVLLGHRRGAHVHPGEVHPLVRPEQAAVADDPVHAVPADARHLHRQQAVVEQDLGARLHVLRERGVGRRQLTRGGPLLGGEDDLLRPP